MLFRISEMWYQINQSDIFYLFSNQPLMIDTEISKIISLSMIIYFSIFPQIIVLGSKKRGGALIGGGGDKWKKYGINFIGSFVFLLCILHNKFPGNTKSRRHLLYTNINRRRRTGIRNWLTTVEGNKAGYTATLVVCGWAGVVFEVTWSLGQEVEAKDRKTPKKIRTDGRTDGPTKGGVESRSTRQKIKYYPYPHSRHQKEEKSKKWREWSGRPSPQNTSKSAS